MSFPILTIAGFMFAVPLTAMLIAAIALGDVPGSLAFIGGWTMAFSVIVAGIGAVLRLTGG